MKTSKPQSMKRKQSEEIMVVLVRIFEFSEEELIEMGALNQAKKSKSLLKELLKKIRA